MKQSSLRLFVGSCLGHFDLCSLLLLSLLTRHYVFIAGRGGHLVIDLGVYGCRASLEAPSPWGGLQCIGCLLWRWEMFDRGSLVVLYIGILPMPSVLAYRFPVNDGLDPAIMVLDLGYVGVSVARPSLVRFLIIRGLSS